MLISGAYAVSWGLQFAVVVDFHEVALAVPLLAFGLCAVVDRRWRAAVWWLLPLILVKEDLGLTVAVAGLCIAFRGGRRPGFTLAVVGVVASVLEVSVLIPLAGQSARYGYLSGLTTGSLGHVLASFVLPVQKLETLLLLVGVAGVVWLRSCLAWVVLPTLLWRFAGSSPTYWGHEWHYSAVLMPIAFVALVDALDRMSGTPGSRQARLASHIPAVVATVGALAVHVTPLHQYLHRPTYASTERSRAAAAAVELVPSGTSVETDIALMSHLVAGRTAYFCGNGTASVRPDWFVTDQAVWGQPMEGRLTVAYAEQLHPGTHYRIVFDQQGITVLHRAFS